ncbi:MAG: hypothetical protein COV68_09650, partial [Nitrospirae bacterium CG11_big_fil_rev_8_21_14_0_20_41_14]
MGLHRKTIELIETSQEILLEHRPMTVRQVYYQLVSRQVIENSKSSYQSVSNALVIARQERIIPWDWIDDRLRRPRTVSMWDGLADFAETAIHAYRRNVWADQEGLVEVWLEKDALSGIFEDILEPYGITLNVGRGYDGWTSIYKASLRYEDVEGVVVLYFGDFDPSGEDMVRSLRERLAFFQSCPEIIKMALTHDDIIRYNLPPDFTKKTDTRAKGFIAKYGDVSVELDALPIDILRQRIIEGIETYMDIGALNQTKQLEDIERHEVLMALTG